MNRLRITGPLQVSSIAWTANGLPAIPVCVSFAQSVFTDENRFIQSAAQNHRDTENTEEAQRRTKLLAKCSSTSVV
jgi:hypothetical protein